MHAISNGREKSGEWGIAPRIAGLNRMCVNPYKLNKPLTEKMLYEF